MSKIQLRPETVQAIEETLNRGAIAEVKIEHGEPAVIQIKRKKVSVETKENTES